MKYFTKEIWKSLQNPATTKESLRLSQIAHDEYARQLATLRPRINADAYRFFAEADVHDGELLEVVVEDGGRTHGVSEGEQWEHALGYPVKVRVRVVDSQNKCEWDISYEFVRRVLLDYPTGDPLFYQQGEGFGDWGYHELTDAGDGFLRHEILFATGSTLAFEFKQVAVKQTLRPGADGHLSG